jgi:cytochrome c553
MKKTLFAAFALAAASQLYAADPAAGQAKSALCIACHGVDGNAPILDTYPKLGGQNAAYLEASIKAYKRGERTGANAALMLPMIANLSDADIADISAYFSSIE